ncbi:MAG: type II toxin-antitoxin system RelE/ParE family toxin [Candidatus Schekmanbacteria bacterium]|nr:type II toxin-antitoxin system RelE/ParE family toxin [Candidatus Schekmanbacteria bacterium]
MIFASKTLNEFAERGRVVPEISNSKIRELFVQDYRLVYKISRLRIEILGIIHGRRDLKKLWEKEDREK